MKKIILLIIIILALSLSGCGNKNDEHYREIKDTEWVYIKISYAGNEDIDIDTLWLIMSGDMEYLEETFGTNIATTSYDESFYGVYLENVNFIVFTDEYTYIYADDNIENIILKLTDGSVLDFKIENKKGE